MTANNNTNVGAPIPVKSHSLRWRPVDIAVGAALGVVSGLIYWAASALSAWVFPLMTALLPGAASLLHGLFYFPVTMNLLIIRKPGAAVYANVVGALVEILFGNAYGLGMIILEAVIQGLCAEVVYAIFRYRRWTLSLTIAAGLLVALVYNAFLLAFFYQGVAFLSPRGLIGTVCEAISGIVFAGFVSWMLYKAIAKTGALDRFASGRRCQAR
ncbi:Hydroxymethylpyrimidine transport system permease protein [Bifidobacterium actinocoloniiforme DSM 22766]|uniref:Hydroxymethylpyrimidine transport system permease protein n=1 Tax=Bifidobacterium actinocoloniiforme DSM 22766 TaxID=1437605 RepID=A0A086Z1N2_9BIFI|nr:ECF transporter S component [Bifidobacterium actinocoloniiforme]AKV55553.1 ABC transporter permease [Bifidobacterium actinocoloniiforme DSM 22766]KFI40432.1 Hydroxymethylpyrimidine transport system permease protein [Bifidobacterium actinocoloniiforme DSM 22766]